MLRNLVDFGPDLQEFALVDIQWFSYDWGGNFRGGQSSTAMARV